MPVVKVLNRDGQSFEARKGATVLAGARGAKAEDRKSTRLNSSHSQQSRMPSSA